MRLELWSGGLRKAYLPDAKEVAVREVLNGEYYVTFLYPRILGDDRYDWLIEENEIRFPKPVENGQRFVIKRVEEVHAGQRIYKRVEAHHIAFILGQYYLDAYIDFEAAKPPEYLLTLIGNNTPFTFYVEGAFDPQDVFEFGEKRKIELLREVRELYGGELSFDNLEITLTTRKGENNGVEIRYKKNLHGIKRTSHSMERITRLYGYGKNGLTIEGWNGHTTKYIDSEYFDPSDPFEGKVEFPEIDDPARLYAAMQKHLKEVELPKVSYDVELVELAKLSPEFDSERFGVGDTITVYDEPLGYAFEARVYEYVRYPFEAQRGSVVLANFRELNMADYIFRATAGSKKAIVYTSKNAVLKGVKYDDSVTIVDGKGITVSDPGDVARVILGQYAPGQYGIWIASGAITFEGGLPDSQIASASRWNGRTTLITDTGIYTGTVTTNQIIAGSAKISTALIEDLVVGGNVQMGPNASISWGQVTGKPSNIYNPAYIKETYIDSTTILAPTITAGVLTGSKIQTAGAGIYPRVEVDPTVLLLAAYNDANNYIAISPATPSPWLVFFSGGSVRSFLYHDASTNELALLSHGHIQLAPNGNIRIANWSKLYSLGASQTLQDRLDNLQNQINGIVLALANKSDVGHTHTVTIPNHNHGLSPGANIATVGGGSAGSFASSGGGTYTTSA